MKLNRLDAWPHVHACPLDLECWRDMWQYGMPMRVHYRKRFWTVPVLSWLSDWRSARLWDWGAAVRVTGPPPPDRQG